MRLAHLLTATAVTAGALVAAAAPAQAHPLDVVIVEQGLACPPTYYEIAQLDQLTICYHTRSIVPEYKIIPDGMPCNGYYDKGWTEYSLLDEFRLCLRWGHQ